MLSTPKRPKMLKSSQNCVIDGHFCVKIGRNFGPFGGKWLFGVFFTVVKGRVVYHWKALNESFHLMYMLSDFG